MTPEATLVGDLGAESIDFLDIVFRLEKAFDIKIPRGELFPEDVLTNAAYVENGKRDRGGLAELRKRMPFANLDEFAKNPNVQDFANLLTVADMCRFVEGEGCGERLVRPPDAASRERGSPCGGIGLIASSSSRADGTPRRSRTSRWPRITSTITSPAIR